MRNLLIAAFAALLLSLVALTVVASLDRGVVTAARALWPDPWFRATLADAYIGFFTIWLWIAWRQRTVEARVLWLVLLFALGNIAIASYVLVQLLRLKPGEPVGNLLLRGSAVPRPSA
jgi:hypothetical protein